MTTYNDTKTPELVERLQTFWKVQDVLKRDYEPFTQADLLFEADTTEQLDADQDGDVEELGKGKNPRLTHQDESSHWHVVDGLDGYYYLAQGQSLEETVKADYKRFWWFLVGKHRVTYQNALGYILLFVIGGFATFYILSTVLPAAVKWVLGWLGA